MRLEHEIDFNSQLESVYFYYYNWIHVEWL